MPEKNPWKVKTVGEKFGKLKTVKKKFLMPEKKPGR